MHQQSLAAKAATATDAKTFAFTKKQKQIINKNDTIP